MKATHLLLILTQTHEFLIISVFVLLIAIIIWLYYRRSLLRIKIYENKQKKKLSEISEQIRLAENEALRLEELRHAFIRNFSDMIRTPMNTLNGFTDLLNNEAIEMKDRLDYAEPITESCTELLKMIEATVQKARIEVDELNKSDQSTQYQSNQNTPLLSTFLQFKSFADNMDENPTDESISTISGYLHRWKGKSILIAEDVDSNYNYLYALLHKTGAKLLRAATGKQAIDIYTAKPDIDLILMDLQMPEMNGYEATLQIRKINSTVPIIAQTAYAFDEDRRKILSSGFDGCVVKPIKALHLLETIERYLSKC